MSSVSDTYRIKINARKRGSYDQIPCEVYYKLDDGAYNYVYQFTPNDTFTDYPTVFTINHRNYDSITVRIKNKDDGSDADRSNIFDKIELFLLNSTTNTYSSNILGDPNLILNNEYLNGAANYYYTTDNTIATIENWKLSGGTIAEKGSAAWNTGITNETLILQRRNSFIEQQLNVSRTYNSTTQLVDVEYTNVYTSNPTMPVNKFQVIVNARERYSRWAQNGPIRTKLFYKLDTGTYQSIGNFLPNRIFTDYSFTFTLTSTYTSITLKIELDDEGNTSDRSTIIDKIELFVLDSNNNSISNNILGDPDMILNNYYDTGPNPGYNYFTLSGLTIGSWHGSGNVISEKDSGTNAFQTGITNETVVLQSYSGTVGSIEQRLNKNGSQITNHYTNAITYYTTYYTRLSQSNLSFNGLTSYSYGFDITFAVSGGSGTGTVTYTVNHDTFGPIPVVDDKITQDISATDISYTVIATKDGDINYNDISATEYFTVQKGNQGQFDLSGVRPFYSYGDTIEFDVSGGSGTGAVTYTVDHPTFGPIPVIGDTLSQDISATDISYTVIATKSGDTNYYAAISATEYFTVQKSDQDQLDLSGVSPFYSYGATIEFDISGGSGTGDVSYTVIHPVFGSIPVEDDKITQDISVADIYYIVTATKSGDTNYYAAISAREYFTVQKGNQGQFDLSGVRPFYSYGDTIEFDVSGGSGTGTTVTYTVEHPTFGPIPVEDDKITQDISATDISYTVIAFKDGDANYNDISATEYFTVQKGNQDQLDISGLLSFYSYGATIVFDVSGGSGTGTTVTYTVDHPTFGPIPVIGIL